MSLLSRFGGLLIAVMLSAQLHAQLVGPVSFPLPPNQSPAYVTHAEYFFDTDPGFGKGSAIPVTTGNDVSVNNFPVNISSLPNGVHRLFVRTENTNGIWSHTNVATFFIIPPGVLIPPAASVSDVTAAEYFLDADPGFGNGHPITLSSGQDVHADNLAIDISALPPGVHRIYVRTKNAAGSWSMTNVSTFYIVPAGFNLPSKPPISDVKAAEYFLDSDPGFGNGHPITISAGQDIHANNVAIDISTLATGVHRIYIRTKNAAGNWSITNVATFYIVPVNFSIPASPAPSNITQVEYFFDADPGIGKGTQLSVPPTADLQNYEFAIDISNLGGQGKHQLYVRTKDQNGVWSLTNYGTVYNTLLSMSQDTLHFGSSPVGVTAQRQLTITNRSTSDQTITGMTLGTGFTTDASLPLTIPAGQNAVVNIAFAPAEIKNYLDSVVFSTSLGSYKTVLEGAGIAQTISWYLSPSGGHDFGTVEVNHSANYTFTIYNSSNIPVSVDNVLPGSPVFSAPFTTGTVIPANGQLSLPVTFQPTVPGQFQTLLKIASTTPNVDTAFVALSGNAFIPGTPPTVQFISDAPYNGTSGVNPQMGQAGAYTYKVLYKSAGNKAPLAGYPKVSIDLNGNHRFDDAGEGVFSMTKSGTSNDYVSGVEYTYTYTFDRNTTAAGYQFDAVDIDGNAATSRTSYTAGPLVTDDVLDLKIFANNITFSNNNPQPGATFTVTATIINSTDVPATNVPVKFYQDTILLGSGTVPSVNPHSTANINYVLNFADEGFYPIKVWIDSSGTLNESNILNNYAIRPVVVGSPHLPGGISVTTAAVRQACPKLQVTISGHAQYFGTSTSEQVAGAEVTINTGTKTYTTTTDANGFYQLVLTDVPCGSGNFAYAVTVTDFTFTSDAASNSIPMPCVSKDECPHPVFDQGTASFIVSTDPCANVVGQPANFSLQIKTRLPNPANNWSSYDRIIPNDTLWVYINDSLIYTSVLYGEMVPGYIMPTIPATYINKSGPTVIRAEFSYVYKEVFGIGRDEVGYYKYHISQTTTIVPQPNRSDLVIGDFQQTSSTSFVFSERNQRCPTAGKHVVKFFDNDNLVQTDTVSELAGASKMNFFFSDPTLVPGVHQFKIIADADSTVDEDNEDNNIFEISVTVPKPELVAESLSASPTSMQKGTQTHFIAEIKNTGRSSGTFKVRFTLDGQLIGSEKVIPWLGEGSSILVNSDDYTISSNENTCDGIVEVFVDSRNDVQESNEENNIKTMQLSADLTTSQQDQQPGSANNPVKIRINLQGTFHPVIYNFGIRDAYNVHVRYELDGTEISSQDFSQVRVGKSFGSVGEFSAEFDVVGIHKVRVIADPDNTVCESNEGNNADYFYIEVTDSKPDLEVLSQFISPSSLNPAPGQNITIVGTVRNRGGKISNNNVMRFLVNDVQLGDDVPFDPIKPGKDTTVAATVRYSSAITGTRTMKITVDPENTLDEERENNNTATRALIVGEAPDLTSATAHTLRLNPNGFNAGDSVIISYSILNKGTVDGTAWVYFMILDNQNTLHQIDSMPFSVAAGQTTIVSKKMYFDITKGKIAVHIYNADPIEYNDLNNDDTLVFSSIMPLPHSIVVNGNLDMKEGIPDDLPGWIGGKLLLGNYNLTVNGSLQNIDTTHFIITNGTGKLTLVNNNRENIFPVATDQTHANFLKINNAGAMDNFSARVVPYVLLYGTYGDTVRRGNVNRTWFIDEQTPGGSDAKVTFMWNQEDEQSGFDRSDSRVAHYMSTWQFGPSANANKDSLNRYSTSEVSVTSFSPFAITNTHSALPLSLVKFHATVVKNDVLLQWETQNEKNTSEFIVEHSTDGQQFEAVGTVAAANNKQWNAYQFIHAHPGAGIHFYRLKRMDKDGAFTYSEVERIVIATGGSEISIFPNPASNMITVRGTGNGGVLQVATADGRIVQQQITQGTEVRLNISGFAHGLYILRYIFHDHVEQIKFAKQ